MKIAKRRAHLLNKKQSVMICLDEFHTIAARGSSLGSLLNMGRMRLPSQRRMITTQAFMKFNSGKRVRFLGDTRWEDTGEAVKLAPKKFIPAQAVRRAAA